MTAPRRMVFVLPYLFRMSRGIERSGSALASELAAQGHSITLYTWDYPQPHPAYDLHPAIRIRRVPNLRYFRAKIAAFFYARWFRQDQPDDAIVYFADLGEAASLCGLADTLRPRVHFIAGYPYEGSPHRFVAFREEGLEKHLHAIIAKSPSNAVGIGEFFGRDIQVLPNGVNLESFQPEKIAPWQDPSLPDGARVILTVAALEERKGIQHLLRGLARLQDPNVHYVVAGEGPYRRELEVLTRELGLAERVHLVGNQGDVRPFYRRADLFALLSEGEGFPNVLLEAWAMGRRALVSEADPFPAIVPNNCGSRVAANDPDAVAEAITTSLAGDEDPSAVIRAHVESTYAWPVIAARYADAFAGPPCPSLTPETVT